MLPVLQSMAGLSRLYSTFSDDQKQLTDKLITAFGASWLSLKNDVDPLLIDLVAMEGSFEDKLGKIMQQPDLIATFLDNDGDGVPDEIVIKCPHCNEISIRKLSNG